MKIYVDANAIIRIFEGADRSQTLLRSIWRASAADGFATSELTFAEVLVGPLRTLRDAAGQDVTAELLQAYEAAFDADSTMLVLPVDRQALRHAAELRAEHRSLKLPDAIHLAAALDLGCSIVVTDDTKLSAVGGRLGLPVCSLDASELASLLSRLESS